MGLLVLFALAMLGCAVPDFAPRFLSISRHAPDLFVAVAAYLGLRGRGVGALAGAVTLGLLQDCGSLDPIGTHAFVLGTIAFVFVRPDRGAPVVAASRALLVALAVVLARLLLVARGLVVAPDATPSLAPLVAALPTALWTGLATWPLLSLLDRARALDDFTGARHGVSA